jgi:hypothetical protein
MTTVSASAAAPKIGMEDEAVETAVPPGFFTTMSEPCSSFRYECTDRNVCVTRP